MKLENKVAIVTGGGTGIGFAISRSLAEAGASVVIVQSVFEKAQKAVDLLVAEGFNAIAAEADISSRKAVKNAVALTVEKFGGVDILVNNAALTGARAAATFFDITDELLDLTIDVNLKGTFIVSQEAAVQMKEKGGTIIHISSIGAYAAQEGASVYCATKAGLTGLTMAMALELAPYNIRVNGIAPGDIKTDTSENILEELKDSGITGKYIRNIPMNRRGRPDEIGSIAVFLASEDSSYITGETIKADGGFLVY